MSSSQQNTLFFSFKGLLQSFIVFLQASTYSELSIFFDTKIPGWFLLVLYTVVLIFFFLVFL